MSASLKPGDPLTVAANNTCSYSFGSSSLVLASSPSCCGLYEMSTLYECVGPYFVSCRTSFWFYMEVSGDGSRLTSPMNVWLNSIGAESFSKAAYINQLTWYVYYRRMDVIWDRDSWRLYWVKKEISRRHGNERYERKISCSYRFFFYSISVCLE